MSWVEVGAEVVGVIVDGMAAPPGGAGAKPIGTGAEGTMSGEPTGG